ncbi:MAG: hypothetical protein ACQERX_03615, partial [Bacillota bacterium]
ALSLVDKMAEERSEIITIIYGKEVKQSEVDKIVEHIEEKYELEIDLIDGGQEVYAYIISVE